MHISSAVLFLLFHHHLQLHPYMTRCLRVAPNYCVLLSLRQTPQSHISGCWHTHISMTKNCHFPLQRDRTGHTSFSPLFHTINLILLFSEWFSQNPCYHLRSRQVLFLCTHLCVKEQTIRRAINVLAPSFPDMFLLEQELPFFVVISPHVVPPTHQPFLRALSLYFAPLVLFRVSD